ncbi:MAG: hypothetical protein AABZ33_03950 [Chloroflexota bacterium]
MNARLRISALVTFVLVVSACSGAATPAPSVAPTIGPAPQTTPEPTATPDACAKENLALVTPGTLTIGADNPAFPPYFSDDPADPDWDFGNPNNGKGFESAVAYAIADDLGFAASEVAWLQVPFNNAIAPGDKDFDLYLTQVSYSAERALAVVPGPRLARAARAVSAASIGAVAVDRSILCSMRPGSSPWPARPSTASTPVSTPPKVTGAWPACRLSPSSRSSATPRPVAGSWPSTATTSWGPLQRAGMVQAGWLAPLAIRMISTAHSSVERNLGIRRHSCRGPLSTGLIRLRVPFDQHMEYRFGTTLRS